MEKKVYKMSEALELFIKKCYVENSMELQENDRDIHEAVEYSDIIDNIQDSLMLEGEQRILKLIMDMCEIQNGVKAPAKKKAYE